MRGNLFLEKNSGVNFDRIAPFYSAIERLTTGSRMQRSRVLQLPYVRNVRRVLIAGEGDGRFLAACGNALPEASFTVVDESAAMLQVAQKRWIREGGDPARVSFICANLLEWAPKQAGFDLIVTHFFLDCFCPAELQTLLARLSSWAGPGTRWLLADFCNPPSGLSRWRAWITLRLAYGIFRSVAGVSASRLTPPDDFLTKLGYVLARRTFSDWGMIHSDLWEKAIAVSELDVNQGEFSAHKMPPPSPLRPPLREDAATRGKSPP